jgi:hypothetical protein
LAIKPHPRILLGDDRSPDHARHLGQLARFEFRGTMRLAIQLNLDLPLGMPAEYVPEWEFLYTRFSGAC